MIEIASNLKQREKAKKFYDLHHSGKLLILPNIWDCLGALLLENLLFPAVATASASVAFTNGYDDGENIPFDTLLTLLKKIVSCVDIPVTADIESGFGENNEQLKENIKRIRDFRVFGIQHRVEGSCRSREFVQDIVISMILLLD